MASKVAIFNTALARIGIDQTVAAPSENSKPARVCRTFYDIARQSALREFPWNFATRVVALAVVPGEAPIGYRYQYAYPTDCLRALVVCTKDGVRSWFGAPISQWFTSDADPRSYTQFSLPRSPFRVITDGARRLILTDLEDAHLIYTMDVTSEDQFDALFTDALSWRLAAEIAVPMLGSPTGVQVGQQAANRYEQARSEAKTEGMNEARDDPMPDSPAIQARA